jgi:hypothetical protein
MKLFNIALIVLALSSTGCEKKTGGPQNQASLEDLNRIVISLQMQGGTKRLDTNQVASFLAAQGKSFPVPPAGKKLVINATTHRFEFVDQ